MPTPLYQRLAAHYRDAVAAGSLTPGARFPSVRSLMAQHEMSLTTALQVCRVLEQEGLLEARPRSGYFVCHPAGRPALRLNEPEARPLDPAAYVGMHARVSEFIARGRQQPVKVNFSGARGAPELYPAEALRQAAGRALREDPELFVRAGPVAGEPVFREVLAKRALASGMVIAPEEIVVTQGCIEALNLALRAVTQPGDIVAVESPTFYGLMQVLESLSLRVLEIPTSPQTGISLEALELAVHHGSKIAALVVVPYLQNPLGSVMPAVNQARLVNFCAEQGIALIEDDTYSALLDEDVPQRALKALDRTGGVIHCASLHKVLAPGLRLGWMTAGRWQARVEMLKYAQSRHNDGLPQYAAAAVMGSSQYDRHLRRLRAALNLQRRQVSDALLRAFPVGTRFNTPPGGLSLWVELPDRRDARALFAAALAEGILIAPGVMFSNVERYATCLRLNCGNPFTPEVAAAVQRLGELCLTRCRPGAVGSGAAGSAA